MSFRLFLIAVLTLSIGATSVVGVGASGSVTEVPDPVVTSSGTVCPSGHNPYDIKLWIHVTRWCAVPAVRKQIQFKVQMEIHNRSDDSLDIGQDQIRLVVREFDPDEWTPPRYGQPTMDRPVQTIYRDERVWAIPANADGAYDPLPNRSGVLTFATHWGLSTLGPGETLKPRYHYGDLGFYVPMQHDGSKAIRNVVGIAYVKNRDIIALCPPDTWEYHVPAASF
jgi:hypothetical protein